MTGRRLAVVPDGKPACNGAPTVHSCGPGIGCSAPRCDEGGNPSGSFGWCKYALGVRGACGQLVRWLWRSTALDGYQGFLPSPLELT